MRRLSMLLAVVLAGVTLGGTQPAFAEALTAGCTDSGYRLQATAYYMASGPWHQWTSFDYKLTGGAGDKSNVNLWVRVDSSVTYNYFSPDSLHNGVTYTHVPWYPVLTDAARVELTEFEAIFDKFLEDARCFARTQPI